jgi:hypothetical protein
MVAHAEPVRCGFVDYADTFFAYPRPPAVHGASEGRTLRDGLGSLPNVRTSEHFAVKWGSVVEVPLASVDRMLVALEAAWRFEITEGGWPPPTGSDTYYVNVYIASTGGVTPDVPAGLAFAASDEEGYPYIGVHHSFVRAYTHPQNAAFLDSTLAHELDHLLQASTGAFQNEASLWYWESTAQWIGDAMFPDEDFSWSAIAEFALTSYLPATYVSRTRDSGGPDAWRDYGAQILHVLAAEKAEPSLIRDSWTTATVDADAFDTLTGLLAQRGISSDQFLVELAARNATWDYAIGEHVRAGFAAIPERYPGTELRELAAEVPSEGTTMPTSLPVDVQPRGLGYVVLRMQQPAGDRLRISIDADPGTAGTASALAARVIVERGTTREYVSLVDHHAEVDVSGATSVYLAVAATTRGLADERFPFLYEMAFVQPSAGCGCGVVGGRGGPASLSLIALAFGVTLRRRRRATPA